MSSAVGRAPIVPDSVRPSALATVRVAVMETDPLRFVGLCSLLEAEPALTLHAITLAELSPSAHHKNANAEADSPAPSGLSSDLILVGDASSKQLFTTIAKVRGLHPGVPILAAGAGLKEEDIIQLLACGSKGYVDHFSPADEFALAIRAVHCGGVWASRRVLALFVDRVVEHPCGHFSSQPALTLAEFHALEAAAQAADAGSRGVLTALVARLGSVQCGVFAGAGGAFTDRESEVLNMLVAGCSNKEIGAELGIEERTVKAHVAKLMRKVGVENRVALSVHAIRQGLVSAPE